MIYFEANRPNILIYTWSFDSILQSTYLFNTNTKTLSPAWKRDSTHEPLVEEKNTCVETDSASEPAFLTEKHLCGYRRRTTTVFDRKQRPGYLVSQAVCFTRRLFTTVPKTLQIGPCKRDKENGKPGRHPF